jgi:phytoene synthase
MHTHWPDRPKASPADIAACRELLRGGSRSFFAASFLLPRQVREPAVSLYAFCRVADDAIDLDADQVTALARLQDRLARIYEGRPVPVSADRALADLVVQFALPRAILEGLLEGFAWDGEGRRYEDLAGLNAYAVRVAGTVGAMMAMLMGVRDPEVLARACDLGVAMQLSNIARDVGEDARNGRIYLPLGWLREAGIDPDAWLAHPVFTPALGSVVRRLLQEADLLYLRAGAGIARLPLACQPGIWAARFLYAEIGREVARAGFDSVSRRAVVSARRKMALLARALAAPAFRDADVAAAPLEQARFLVQAVRDAPSPPRIAIARNTADDPSIGEQLVWVVDLFARLERMERMQRPVRREREAGVVS